MLDLGLSKKLKDAGLAWEPALGDLFYYQVGDHWEKDVLAEHDIKEATHQIIADWIFVPRLDQLIIYMEERGYRVESKQDACYIFHPNKPHICPWWQKFPAENRTNAAGEALLWILQQEQAVD